jgi:ubiquinone/menaquinone biosynthesis C-methylase UbiE
MAMKEQSGFDAKAQGWDEDVRRVRLAEQVVSAVQQQVPLTRDMVGLDFGCGTGLVTMGLAPLVKRMVGIDSSRGMIKVLSEKVLRRGVQNVTANYVNLDDGDRLSGSYDLVMTSMTLHHVVDVPSLLAEFARVLKVGGWLCLADLDLDSGRFHDDNAGVVHFGIDRNELQRMMEQAGFRDVTFATAASILKKRPAGEEIFTVFLATGRRM